MLPHHKSKYDPVKLERIKTFMQEDLEKGKPIPPYEIFVDAMKVVKKTTDPSEFDRYLDYLDDETEKVTVLIYDSDKTPRNTKYIFELKEKPQLPQVIGLGNVDINQQIEEKLTAERKNWDMEQLRKENQELQKKVDDGEEYIEKLQQLLAEEKAKKQTIAGLDIGDIFSVGLEGLIRRNTDLISRMGGGTLAGMIEQDNEQKAKNLSGTSPDTTATYKKKEEGALSEEDKRRIEIVKMMEQNFSQEEATQVWNILKRLAEDRSLIATVLELIQQK